MSKRRQEIERPWWPVAERMRRARLYAGIETQPQMAELVGVSRAQLNKHESGTMQVPIPILYAYAHITGFDFEWLKDGDSEGVVLAATPTKPLRGRDSNSQPTDRAPRPGPSHRVPDAAAA